MSIKSTLILLIVALVAVLSLSNLLSAGGDFIESSSARTMVQEGALLVDVRTPGEFGQKHIEGALNIPLQELEARVAEFGEKGRVIVLYCRSGNRSGQAKTILEARGYTDVHNLGPMTAW